LGPDGLADIGRQMENGDIFVNKYCPVIDNNNPIASTTPNDVAYKQQPDSYKGALPAYVDRVIITSTPEEPYLIKMIQRQTRVPEVGDKFSSRHGQKGVVGLIVPQEDMPFSERSGWCPDLVMNPHGFPSRMTVGKMIELISGKAGVLSGAFKYGTAFAGDPVEETGKILVQNGFSSDGKDLLMSGITGEMLPCFVFSGPIYY
jgi:DNA-directed RNA polymerase III subunit RPC2